MGKGVMFGIGGGLPTTDDEGSSVAQKTDAQERGPAEGCVRDTASLAGSLVDYKPNSALLTLHSPHVFTAHLALFLINALPDTTTH
jgi:hypothetical protein